MIALKMTPVFDIFNKRYVDLEEGDLVNFMDPEMIITKGYLDTIQDIDSYFLKCGIDPMEEPYSIYELFELGGIEYMSILKNDGPKIILAKFCVVNHRFKPD